MAQIRWHIGWRCILSVLLLLFALAKLMLHKLIRWSKFLSAHLYTVSVVVSVLFGVLNIFVYFYGCERMKPFVDPVKLKHGYAPVFPKHYFHGPDSTYHNVTLEQISLNDTDKLNAFFYENNLQDSLLSPVLPVVHIIWCDVGPFTFSHFLSTLSAFKAIRPSVMYLHLIKEPDIDPDGYFQFLPDLLRDLPPLVTIPLQYTSACYGGAADKVIAYMQILGTLGGIAINGRTIVVPLPTLTSMMNNKINLAIQEDTALEPLLFTAQSNVLTSIPPMDSLSEFLKSHLTQFHQCGNVRTFSIFAKHICIYMHEDLYPVIIFNGTSHFDHLARWIAYGTSEQLISKPANHLIVPNIVHYVWLGERELNFYSYLSVMSSIYVLKADIVYIHGDYKPTGALWKEVEQNPKVKFIHRDFPSSVYGQPIKKFVSHASDYLRADILLRYGGVYCDWDVIFLKELPHSLRRHNTTVNVDWPQTGAFPDVLNLGVLISAPGATFLRHFLESYRWYLDSHWSYNAIHMPYKVYEKQPQSLNVDRHLQILCAEGRCHGTWLEGYKEDSADHLDSKKINWRIDALAIHWTYPDPLEFTSKASLMASQTITAQIGKHVLRHANIKS